MSKPKQKKPQLTLAETFAQRLWEIRAQKKLKQEDIATRAKISISYVSMLERGTRTPPLDTVEAVAKALGVSPIELLKAA